MENYIIKQWEENKHKLENYFRVNTQANYASDYVDILKKIIEFVVTNKNDYQEYNQEKITVIDDGNYEGTQIFLIPTKDYSPTYEDYLVTHTYYGSCSGCDTLQAIHGYDMGFPTEEQVAEYMTLALHLIQKMKPL